MYSQIDKYDYRFNYIEPVVLENKKVLKLGETYSATIILFAADTTAPPNFIVDGEYLELWNGTGRYNIKTVKSGNFDWKGTMKYFNPAKGDYEEFHFSSSYIVK